jgi:hypothetical protein
VFISALLVFNKDLKKIMAGKATCAYRVLKSVFVRWHEI